MTKSIGHPPCLVRIAYRDRFGLTEKQMQQLTNELMCRLSCCKSDEARRLILGISSVQTAKHAEPRVHMMRVGKLVCEIAGRVRTTTNEEEVTCKKCRHWMML